MSVIGMSPWWKPESSPRVRTVLFSHGQSRVPWPNLTSPHPRHGWPHLSHAIARFGPIESFLVPPLSRCLSISAPNSLSPLVRSTSYKFEGESKAGTIRKCPSISWLTRGSDNSHTPIKLLASIIKTIPLLFCNKYLFSFAVISGEPWSFSHSILARPEINRRKSLILLFLKSFAHRQNDNKARLESEN